MVLKGHVSDGVVILDGNTPLPDGITVFVSVDPIDEDKLPYRRYRGTPYTYIDPLEPAAPESDWDAAR